VVREETKTKTDLESVFGIEGKMDENEEQRRRREGRKIGLIEIY